MCHACQCRVSASVQNTSYGFYIYLITVSKQINVEIEGSPCQFYTYSLNYVTFHAVNEERTEAKEVQLFVRYSQLWQSN